MVTVRQNRYSVPVAPGRAAGRRPDRRPRDRRSATTGAGRRRHERLQGRFGISAQLDHYLELLERKPGALAGSVGAAPGTRARGGWPGCFDELWAAADRALRRLRGRPADGRRAPARREHGPGRVELAVRGAIAAGAHDGRAVAVLAAPSRATGRPAVIADLPDGSPVSGAPPPTSAQYDQLVLAERRR